jgi:hypothetical protein
LGENQRNQAGLLANLYSQGFEGAMGRAAQQAAMGFNAAGAGANLGMTAGSPDLWNMEMLKRGFAGTPYGQTYTGTGSSKSNQSGYSLGWSWPGAGAPPSSGTTG